MSYCKIFGRWAFVFALLFPAGLLLGCRTSQSDQNAYADTTKAAAGDGASGSEIIHVGELLVITFSDLPTEQQIPDFTERVNDEGTIKLILNQKFTAAGKTRSELEKEIRERYVPRYYVRMTVTIKPQERTFYVEGEVRNPGPKPYTPPMTVLKAIASAGYFTDYARQTKVTITRLNGKKVTVNCEKARRNSELDLPVYPGDTIHVPRRII